MSRSPNGTLDPVSSPTSACSLSPRTAPRVWIPTSATRSEPGFFSTISCAIRTRMRRKSSRSRTTLSFALSTRPFLASPDRVKGTDAASLAAVPDPLAGRCVRTHRNVRPPEATREAIEVHQAAGRRFQAGGVQSFVREQGPGTPVVLLHGVPTSCFLYRKGVPLVAHHGLRAAALDSPALGRTAR